MRRFDITPRSDWQKQVEDLGFIWHTANGTPYWNESAYYSFTLKQVEEIEAATENCHNMFVEAAQHVIDNNLFSKFGIPEAFIPRLIKDWNDEPPALNYGRFDFGFDGVNPPKLFEYNADTPTSLVEASVVQWEWKEQLFPDKDQFNSIHERFIERWQQLHDWMGDDVHFTHGNEESGEDAITTAYMMDCAQEAGFFPIYVPLETIGWDKEINEFVDHERFEIQVLYKLYPWEWLVNEEFGKNILKSNTLFIEPSWKMLFSNKAILPILWKLFPNHPNLLATADHMTDLSDAVWKNGFVSKPILAREGSNIQIHDSEGELVVSEGPYEKSTKIYQERFRLPNFGGRYPVIGSWCVNGSPAGMGIREDGLITGNTANFIPHIIEG